MGIENNTSVNMNTALQNELDNQILTFWVDNQMFGVSITNVAQIVSMLPVTEMPDSPIYVKGIINLRGSIIPIIDMRIKLNKPEVEYTDRTCIVITNIKNSYLGFIVDEVDAVLHISPENISEAPRFGSDIDNRYLNGIVTIPTDGGEKIVLWLNLLKILLEDEFDDITGALANM